MRLAVAGTGSALGEAVVPWLEQAGHEVTDLGRLSDPAVDLDVLAAAVAGCDTVLHLSGAPARLVGRFSGRRHDDSTGVERLRRLVRATETAGVRRLVATSSSLLYADSGSDWITEESPVCVTSATEAASEREHLVQQFADAPCRHGVVLRTGLLLGDSPLARWSVDAAGRGRPVTLGDADGFVHLLHSADAGSAVDAALQARSGTYNVGSAPVRRGQVMTVLADVVDRPRCDLLGPLRARWAGPRAEPLGRSLRVSSEMFRRELGWRPRHDALDDDWFRPAPRLPDLSAR